MIRANVSDSGINLGSDNANMAYLYGLGDFFSMMFEDTSVADTLLESTTLTASEIYSRFLQLASTLSLQDIQTTTGSQLKLVLLNSADLVEGTTTEYTLPQGYVSARYVANRPLAPTELLETDVDFRISQDEAGPTRITFAQPLDSYAVSSRLLKDGVNKQYALWFVDAHLDERLISQHFGNLIGLDPENSTERFANFVYGLYYMYTQGPTLDVMRKGLNLVLGIPLARLQETVIDIRSYLQTDQYLVVTDQNQYLIPFGLQPSVAVGDVMNVGDELARWVEVKDYVNDGEWWVNLYIPRNLIPTPPPGQNTRYATHGSSLEYIMRNYLRMHTFLVNVNVTSFKNNQQFRQIFDIIRKAKPAYTQPIYVWTVRHEEVVGLGDDAMSISLRSNVDEDIGGAFRHMHRCSSTRLLRGSSRYIRFNSPSLTSPCMGESAYENSSNNTLQALHVQGYSNSVSQFRPNTATEARWINTLANRGSDTWRGTRGQVGYRRGLTAVDDEMHSFPLTRLDSVNLAPVNAGPMFRDDAVSVESTRLCDLYNEVPEGARIVPITVMTQDELELKCNMLGVEAPARFENVSYLRRKLGDSSVNAVVVNNGNADELHISSLYPDLFRRDSVLPQSMDVNREMLRQFLPAREHVTELDTLAVFRISCELVSICLLSYDSTLVAPSSLPVEDELDTLTVAFRAPAMRGLAHHGSPFYLSRGNANYLVAQPPAPDEVDLSIEPASFLQRHGVAVSARVVPLTVISSSELELKCGMWGIPTPPSNLKYFFLSTEVSIDPLNSHRISTSGQVGYRPVDLVETTVDPISGQVGTRYNLFPDFYRRDSAVPTYKNISRDVLHEYFPMRSEVTALDHIMGFRIAPNVIALYLISNSLSSDAVDYWNISYTPTPHLVRVDSGVLATQGLVVVPPYSESPKFDYNNHTPVVNDKAINDLPPVEQVEFLYRDMYNTSIPVNRGGIALNHILQHRS